MTFSCSTFVLVKSYRWQYVYMGFLPSSSIPSIGSSSSSLGYLKAFRALVVAMVWNRRFQFRKHVACKTEAFTRRFMTPFILSDAAKPFHPSQPHGNAQLRMPCLLYLNL